MSSSLFPPHRKYSGGRKWGETQISGKGSEARGQFRSVSPSPPPSFLCDDPKLSSFWTVEG